jgi:hypothetical protein
MTFSLAKKLILAAMAALLIFQIPVQRAEAQGLRTIVTVGVFLGAMIWGAKTAQAEQQAREQGQQGTVYRLGSGWPTTGQYCISLTQGYCSVCDPDWNQRICRIRPNEPLLNISRATIN